MYGQLYLKTPLHTIALIVAVINATCLIWAGMSRPVWVTRESVEPL
jgi:predicted membrane protein